MDNLCLPIPDSFLATAGSISVAHFIFSDTKSFAFTHVLSDSIHQQLELAMRAGYKDLH